MTLAKAIEIQNTMSVNALPDNVEKFNALFRPKDQVKGKVGFDKTNLFQSSQSKEKQVPGFNNLNNFSYEL